MIKAILTKLFPKTIAAIKYESRTDGYEAFKQVTRADQDAFKQTEKEELQKGLVFSIGESGVIVVGFIVGWMDAVPIVQPLGTEDQDKQVICFGITKPFHPIYLKLIDTWKEHPKTLYWLLSNHKPSYLVEDYKRPANEDTMDKGDYLTFRDLVRHLNNTKVV